MKYLKFIWIVLAAVMLQSCYEDYKFDYEYTTTYFARQKPLRTLVEQDGQTLDFKFGVVLAGKYSNDRNWKVEYMIDESLLTDYPDKQLLPSDYYTLSDDKTIVIEKGKIVGEVAVSIDKNKLMNDPKGLDGTYVLPVRILSSETDSVLEGMDYSLIAVKYLNKYHANYWVKGEDSKYDSAGKMIDSETYAVDDLVSNRRATLTTLSKEMLSVPYVGRFASDGYAMILTANDQGVMTLSGSDKSKIKNVTGSGTYDADKKSLSLDYSYTDSEGFNHKVKDQLIYSDLELKMELW